MHRKAAQVKHCADMQQLFRGSQGIEEIEASAFRDFVCRKQSFLKRTTILTNVGLHAFFGCSWLLKVDVFAGYTVLVVVRVPVGTRLDTMTIFNYSVKVEFVK